LSISSPFLSKPMRIVGEGLVPHKRLLQDEDDEDGKLKAKKPHESPPHSSILKEILMRLGEVVRGLKEMGEIYIRHHIMYM
jgi:hypothetical protein